MEPPHSHFSRLLLVVLVAPPLPSQTLPLLPLLHLHLHILLLCRRRCIVSSLAITIQARLPPLFEKMRDGINPTIDTYSALSVGLCEEGRSAEANLLIHHMKEQHLYPTEEIYTSLISCYCRSMSYQLLLSGLLCIMRRGCIYPIAVTSLSRKQCRTETSN